MIKSAAEIGRLPRFGQLAACVALALASANAIAQPIAVATLPVATSSGHASHPAWHQSAIRADTVATSTQTLQVTSCADNQSVGTLRHEMFLAGNGDTVDLSNLSCSTITLANGALPIGQPTLRIVASASNPITIDAHGASRVIDLGPVGDQLYLQNLQLINGYLRNDDTSSTARGGCIAFRGQLTLSSTVVSNCKVVNGSGRAEGGAIFADILHAYASAISGSIANGVTVRGGGVYAEQDAYFHDSVVSGNQALSSSNVAGAYANGGGIDSLKSTHLVRTTVSGNVAQATYGLARGGGIYNEYIITPGGVDTAYSTISGNSAISPSSTGGGVVARGTSHITYSTLDHNQSVNNSALVIPHPGSALVRNSTISGNTATTGSSTLYAASPITLDHCTIAFNVAAGTSAGVYLYPAGNVDLESTIIASNTSLSGDGFDLVSRVSVSGSHNLVQYPALTLSTDIALVGIDPLLAPLANNGGHTKTHALQTGSAALDAGKNPQFLAFDQRGPGFGRVVGTASDIGALESDPDRIFSNGFE